MDVLFLLWSIYGAILTWNVFRPLRWSDNGTFVFLTFSFGWLIGDLSLHWIVVNSAITLGVLALGGIETVFGWAALLIQTVSWSFLAFRLKNLFELNTQVHQQFISSLGSGYESEILPKIQQTLPPRGFDWKSYWNPILLLKNPKIERLQNIVYFEARGVRLELDIYRPTNEQKDMPIFLHIHGGAWAFGTRTQSIPLMTRLAENGWLCITISYRLSPEAVFPEHIIDYKRAIRWTKENAVHYGGDPKFIVASGGSAGGHLSALATLTPNAPEFQPGFESEDTEVQGCVAYYGIYDLESPFEDPEQKPLAAWLPQVMRGTPQSLPLLYHQASPIHRISQCPPPFLLIQGEIDPLISIKDTERFHRALQEANTPRLSLLKLPLLEHGFDTLPTIGTQQLLPHVEQYLALLRSDYIRGKQADTNENDSH